MRKILLFAFMAILSVYASSQVIEKGDKLLGGDFSVYIYTTDNYAYSPNRSSNAGIFPSYGIAVKNDLVFGPRGSITYSRTTSRYTDSTNSSDSDLDIGVGLFLKKYKLLQNKFGVYFNNAVSGNMIYTKEYSTGIQNNKGQTGWGARYEFEPGVFYKFSDRFLGEANIGGIYASYYKLYSNTSSFYLGVSFLQYFSLGISYQLNKKKTED